jgi:hypothetical protein
MTKTDPKFDVSPFTPMTIDHWPSRLLFYNLTREHITLLCPLHVQVLKNVSPARDADDIEANDDQDKYSVTFARHFLRLKEIRYSVTLFRMARMIAYHVPNYRRGLKG